MELQTRKPTGKGSATWFTEHVTDDEYPSEETTL
jgi:hypothetical protein